MNANKELWEKGDFTRIACLTRQSGEAVVQSLEITPPVRVSDVSYGDPTAAVPLAPLGAELVGIDIVGDPVEAWKKREAGSGLKRLEFQEGDAYHPQEVGDDWFGLTLSLFGFQRTRGDF